MLKQIKLIESEEKLTKVCRLYAFISQINQKIVRISDEAALFRNACVIAIEFGGFKMAWIGLFDAKNEKINLIDENGIASEDIQLFTNVTINKKGPQAHVLKTETHFICNDVTKDLETEGWTSWAIDNAIKSCIVLPIKKAGLIIGTFNLYSTEPNFAKEEELKLLIEITGDISFALDRFEKIRKLKVAEELLVSNEKKFHHVLNNMIEGAQIHDFDWRYLYVNDTLQNFSTYTREELMGFTLMEKYPGVENTEMFKIFDQGMTERVGAKFESEFIFPNGIKADFEMSIQPIPEGIVILSIDRTEEKKAKEKLQKANRLFDFRSAINQCILHATTEDELLNSASNLAVDIGHFVTGLIDMVERNTGSLNMTCYNDTIASVSEFKMQSGENFKRHLLLDATAERALNSAKYALSNDVLNDPTLNRKLEELIKNDVGSVVSFPLKKFGRIVGVFSFVSSILNFFELEEIAILEEATSDISFALEVLDQKRTHRVTEKLVLQNERRFRSLVENGADAVVILTAEGKPLYASPTVERVLGYTEEETLGLDLFELFHLDDKVWATQVWEQIMLSPGVSIPVHPSRIRHKNGTWRWLEGTLTNLLHDPAIEGIVDNFRDVTEKIYAEQRLKNSELFNRSVLNSLNSHVAVVNELGIIVAVNEAWKQFSIDNGEANLDRTAVGSNYFDVCKKSAAAGIKDAADVLAGMQDVMNKRSDEYSLEYPCHSSTERRWFLLRVLKFDGDQPMVVVSHQNISERKNAEENLQKSEAQLKEAQSISQLGNWEISLPDNVVNWSDELYKIFGYSKGELEPSTEVFMSFIHPDDKEYSGQKVDSGFEKFEASEMIFRFIRKDGIIRYGYAEWKFEFDKSNRPLRVFGIVQDVTEKKEADIKLLQSEQHNRALIENITDAILLTDENGIVIYQSSSADRIGGFTKEDLMDRTVFDFIHPDDLQRCIAFFQETAASPGVPMQNQYRILHKGGYFIWIEGTIVNLLDDENVKAFIINYRDITERKKTEDKLDTTLLELEQRVEERTKDLTEKNKDITDSINYAKRIQVGLLSPYSQLTELFPKSFILSEPQNIVSGDFFWCHQRNNKKIVLVADCTGHGVPGALMSIIGNNLLNAIVVDEHIDNPSEILHLLDERLKATMKGGMGEIKDGMDISLCVIDTYFKEVYFAGAYRPLFISDENGKIIELKGNSCAIGGTMGETKKTFVTKRFSILHYQRIYLTTDGYYSQFGGPLGKKFMKKHFRETLEQLQEYPLEEQKDKLMKLLTDWTGMNERIDDVMVVGIEL